MAKVTIRQLGKDDPPEGGIFIGTISPELLERIWAQRKAKAEKAEKAEAERAKVEEDGAKVEADRAKAEAEQSER